MTATDPTGLSATQVFTVTVAASASFSDEPIQPGVTPIRAVHFLELRWRIDALRRAAGLAAFSWTDSLLLAGVTRVRREHLLELRSALSDTYRTLGRPVPTWTDAVPKAGAIPIRARHIGELRRAVENLGPPGPPKVESYEITLTDVRFDRAEQVDSDWWTYSVRVAATNTGTRSFGRSSGVQPALFIRFYDRVGNPVRGRASSIFGGDAGWIPGEERTDTGYQYVRSDERSTIEHYRLGLGNLAGPGDAVACFGCNRRWFDVSSVSASPSR